MSAPVEEDTITLTREGDFYVARDRETGVTSQGGSRSEALANLAEAIALYEEPIPEDVEPEVPDAPWFDS